MVIWSINCKSNTQTNSNTKLFSITVSLPKASTVKPLYLYDFIFFLKRLQDFVVPNFRRRQQGNPSQHKEVMTPLSKVTPISKFNLVSGQFLWYNVCRITDVLGEPRVKSPLTALHRNAHWEPKKNVKPFHCLQDSKRTPLGQLSRATKCTITIIINSCTRFYLHGKSTEK